MANPTISPEELLAKRREKMRQYYKDNKESVRATQREYYQSNKEKVRAINANWATENKEKMRSYRKQWETKNPGKTKLAIQKWRENNPEKERASSRKWNEENKERRNATIYQWQQENRDKVREARRRWAQNHPDRARANHVQRKTRKLQQMPKWAIISEINNIYKHCPPDMQVDHIVPLRGITADGYKISGLHVSWNLQYLTLSENCRKYNRMRPEDHILAGAPVEL